MYPNCCDPGNVTYQQNLGNAVISMHTLFLTFPAILNTHKEYEQI